MAEDKTVDIYDSSDFVVVADEIPDVILEMRYYTTFNFIGDQVRGYEEPIALLTKEAVAALKKVNEEVKKAGYRIKIFDAYRPDRAVRHFEEWENDDDDLRMKKYFYPDLTKKEIIEGGYIALKSSHSKGSTLDLTLFDPMTGRDVDMGGPFDFFGELSWPLYEGVTKEQYERRMLLRGIMVNCGFKVLENEWWHFTLKDEPFPKTFFDFPVRKDIIAGK